MTAANPLCLRQHFAKLKDPRRCHRRRHRLLDIITIAICAVVTIREPAGLRQGEAWAGLCVIGLCYRERTVGEQTSTEARYFIGSKQAGARHYGKALRGHWGIENNLHWQLDITFGEDASRVSKRHGAENFALLRRLALMLLKRHPEKQSLACKRLAAALDTDLLEEILRGDGNSGKG